MDKIKLQALSKIEIPRLSKNLMNNDIDFLVQCLAEKDNKIRYNAFLLLQEASQQSSIVYPYWNILANKLDSDNSYQRSLGLMLLAENVRWDKDNKFAEILDKYLQCCADEKFITARQAIQGLTNIINTTNAYNDKIKQYLTTYPLNKYPKNQQNLLNKDIQKILQTIEKKNT